MGSIKCDPSAECPLWERGICPTEDLHHPYFPKKIVRQLGRTAVEMNNALAERGCRHRHNTIHSTVPFNLPTYAQIVEWERMRRNQDGQIQEPDR